MHTTLHARSTKPTAFKRICTEEETDITVTTPQDVQETTDRTLGTASSVASKNDTHVPRIERINFLPQHFLHCAPPVAVGYNTQHLVNSIQLNM